MIEIIKHKGLEKLVKDGNKAFLPMDLSKLDPIHPGEIIKEECLDPLKISINKAAINLCISPSTLNRLIKAQSNVSPEMAFRLAKAFDTTPEFWLNLQMQYDIATTRNKVDTTNIKKLCKLY